MYKRQAERFALYHALLVEGNARMNLTTVLEPEEAVDRHFLDSLAPVALGLLPQGARAVDVGTGAGFPGIPLLIARPDLRLTLVDSLNKRLEFLRDVLNRLGLSAEDVYKRQSGGSVDSLCSVPAYISLHFLPFHVKQGYSHLFSAFIIQKNPPM